MKLQHFRDAVAIAEKGSIRAAARHLGLAQPALTRNLAELERELGAPLFERRARGVAVTPTGQAFLARARLILNEVRRAGEEAGQIQGATAGNVTAGLSIAAHLALLPAALKAFRSRYPQIRLHIIEGFYPTLERGLCDGAVDFYVGVDPGGKIAPDLTREVLFANRRIVLCRAAHPLVSATSLRDLCDADWATTSITAEAADEFHHVFERYGLPSPKLTLRTQSALTLMTCLLHSDLLAMVPVQWNEFTLTRGSLTAIPIQEELAARPMVTITRTGFPLTPAAMRFLDLLRRKEGASFLGLTPSPFQTP